MNDKEKIRLLKLDIENFNREKTQFDIEIFKAKKEIEKIKKGTFSGTFTTYYDYE